MKKQNQESFKNIQLGCSTSLAAQGTESSFNNCLYKNLNQLLSLQIQVNSKLLINAILTDQFMKQLDESNGKTSSSEGSTLVSRKQKNEPHKNEKRPLDGKISQKKKKQRNDIKYHQQSSESEYQPSEDQQIIVQYKLSQSKNVPKNYGKSILGFIKKKDRLVTKILQKLCLNLQQFQQFLDGYNNNINTIAELRSLWIESEKNPYAKALRMISSEYLRKHSLGHIFNSRVENFGKHIKYRQKIIKAIQKPEQFTQMKDF